MLNVLQRGKRHGEGRLAHVLEDQAARVPSDAFLWAAIGTVVGSVTLRAMGRDRDATLVGLLVPTILVLGVYKKLLKLLD